MKEFLTIISKIMSTILSIVFLLILTLLIALLLIGNSLSKKNITTIIKNIDLEKKETNSNQITISDYITNYTTELGIPKETAAEIITNKEISEMLADYVGDLSDFYLYGKELPVYTKEKIIVNITKINNLLPIDKQINLTEYQIQETTDKINQIGKDIVNKTEEKNNQRLSFKLDNSKINSIKGSLLFSLIIIFFLIALIRFKLYSPLGWCGIPMILVGGFYIIVGMMKSVIHHIAVMFKDFQYIVEILGKIILSQAFIYGVVIFLIGIAMTIIYYVIKKKNQKSNKPLTNKEIDREIAKL